MENGVVRRVDIIATVHITSDQELRVALEQEWNLMSRRVSSQNGTLVKVVRVGETTGDVVLRYEQIIKVVLGGYLGWYGVKGLEGGERGTRLDASLDNVQGVLILEVQVATNL